MRLSRPIAALLCFLLLTLGTSPMWCLQAAPSDHACCAGGMDKLAASSTQSSMGAMVMPAAAPRTFSQPELRKAKQPAASEVNGRVVPCDCAVSRESAVLMLAPRAGPVVRIAPASWTLAFPASRQWEPFSAATWARLRALWLHGPPDPSERLTNQLRL